MSMRTQLRGEGAQRSFLTLLSLVFDEGRDAREVLDAAAAHWRDGRLGRAARALRDELEEGATLSGATRGILPGPLRAALESGEMRDDAAAGVRRALAIVERRARAGRKLRRAALYPLATAWAGAAMAGVFGAAALPALEALRQETAQLTGAPEPGGVVSWLAAHPEWALAAALVVGLLPAVLLLLRPLAGRSVTLARMVLRLPVAGAAARARAAADFLEGLGELLAAEVPLDRAWAAAAGAVSNAAMREALQGAGLRRVRGGDPAGEALSSAGMPRYVVCAFESAQLDDNGVGAAEEAAGVAADEYRARMGALGRAGAAAGYALAASVVFGLLWVLATTILGLVGV